jgi:hypothetical protein
MVALVGVAGAGGSDRFASRWIEIDEFCESSACYQVAARSAG